MTGSKAKSELDISKIFNNKKGKGNRKHVYRMMAVFLILMLTLSLFGCKQQTKDTVKKQETTETVYTPEFYQLTKGEEHVGQVFSVGQKLYYTTVNWEEEITKTKLFCKDLTNMEKEAQEVALKPETSNEEEAFGNTMVWLLREDGSQVRVDSFYKEGQSEGAEGTQQFLMYLIDGEGVFQNTIDITAALDKGKSEENGGSVYLQYGACDQEGNIILADGNSHIWIFGGDGTLKKDWKMEAAGQFGNGIMGMGTLSKGRVFILTDDGNQMKLLEYDAQKQDFSGVYDQLPTDCWNTSIEESANGGVLLKGQNDLYEYDLTSKSYKKITKWLDCDLNPDFVQTVYAAGAEEYVVLYSDWNTNENSLVVLRKMDEKEAASKKTITLGCMNLTQKIQTAIVDFNRSQKDIRIQVKDYAENIDWQAQNGDNTYEAATARYKNDLVGGNAPDLFLTSGMDLNVLVSKKIIEDLNPYLEQSGSMKKADFIEPVIQAYEIDGVQTCLPISFSVLTMVGRQEDVGTKAGWTFDEMIALSEKYPDSMIFPYASNNMVLMSSVMLDLDSYVDWKTGECKFNTEEFQKVLEFAKKYPGDDQVNYEQSEIKQLRTHEALLLMTGFSSPQDWSNTERMFEKPVNAIGYPSSNSTGVKIIGDDGVCIASASKNKEEAWKFIEFMFENEKNTDPDKIWGFSSLKSVYDKLIEKEMEPEYERDENGNIVKDEAGNPKEIAKGSMGWDDVVIEVYAMKKEEADRLWELINRISGAMSYDENLMNIITEEAAPFFQNQKSVTEVMDIIQSRAKVYLNENR